MTVTQSDSGQPTETWAALATVWGSLSPLKGYERTASPGHAAHEDVAIQIRWATDWADLNPKDRAICQGVTYDLLAVHEIGRRQGMKIIARRKAD